MGVGMTWVPLSLRLDSLVSLMSGESDLPHGNASTAQMF